MFDFYLTSGEICACKDKNDVNFNLALERTNLKSNECIFVDNKPKNLVIPKEMGFKVFEYEFERDSTQDLIDKFISNIE